MRLPFVKYAKDAIITAVMSIQYYLTNKEASTLLCSVVKHAGSGRGQAAQALSMNHTSNTIWHRNYKGSYGIFYKISMEVVKCENSR